MQLTDITSLTDSRLAVFRDLKTTNLTRQSGLFVAEGTTLVERVLNSDFDVNSVLISEQKFANFQSRIPTGTAVYRVSRDIASSLVGYQFHIGVLAAVRRKPVVDLSQALPETGSSLVLFADHIIDQENLGAIVRIGSAFGASAIIAGPGSADPFSRRVIRVSMGNGLFLPIVESTNAPETLRLLKKHGYFICATVLTETATDLASFQFPERTVLVLGNETHGVAAETQKACDDELTVRMLNNTDSLNVAVAAGVFSYTFRSQHAQTTAM